MHMPLRHSVVGKKSVHIDIEIGEDLATIITDPLIQFYQLIAFFTLKFVNLLLLDMF